LSGRTGKASSQASTSSDRHMDLPPTMRDRGKVPARIQDQRVGYDMPPAIRRTSGFVNKRSTSDGGLRAGGTRRRVSGASPTSSLSAASACCCVFSADSSGVRIGFDLEFLSRSAFWPAAVCGILSATVERHCSRDIGRPSNCNRSPKGRAPALLGTIIEANEA
jgi:hypothetical protein